MTSFFIENATHIHLLLNHVPTIGSVFALGLLLLAFLRRSEALQHAALEALFIIAVVTLPVYTTGAAAHRELRELKEASDVAMRAHQDAAIAAFIVTEFAGFVAWLALWRSRRGRSSQGLVVATTLLTVLSLAVMARAATLGGEIRHPEIRAAAAPAEGTPQFVQAAVADVMSTSRWVWPAAESVHFLGLSLTIGVLLAVNLRILGVMRHIPFGDVHRLLPWGMLGFGANLITGMMFFIGSPGQYVHNGPFYWKLIFLMLAGGNFLYLTVFDRPWTTDRFEIGPADKAMAVASIFSWLAVLYAGRMLPFIGNAF